MRGGCLQEAPDKLYSEFTWKLLVFWKNWSLRRDSCNWRFDYTSSLASYEALKNQ